MAKSLRKKKKPARRKKPAKRKAVKKKTVSKRHPTKRKATKRKATKRKTVKRKATKRKATKRKATKRKATRKKPAKKKATKKSKSSKKTARKKPAKRKPAKKKSTSKKPAKKKTPAKRKATKKKKATASKKKPKVFVYNMYDLKKPKGPASAEVNPHRKLSGKSTTEACNIKGAQMQVGIAHKRQGTGSKLHTHPNEQYNFVLKGTLVVDIDGRIQRCPAGSVVHIPAGTVHSTCASEEGDAIFYVCKDNRHGMAGPPIDGKEDGARYLPGFEPTEEQRQQDADKTRKVTDDKVKRL